MKKIFVTFLTALTVAVSAIPARAGYPDFTQIAEKSIEAVLYVAVTGETPNVQIDPFFKYFFGDIEAQPQKSSGSGVIISNDGYIITNNHVVANAAEVEVTLNNEQTYSATVVGTDPATDIAVLKIEAKNLPFLRMGNSDQLRLGEWVLAIGSPLGLRGTITAGIVSAKGRSMPNYSGEFKIESFIQTDAAVNPGNSGGALVNTYGELIGINTAIISQTGSFTGYSFAVPVNIARKIADDIIQFGSVRRAVLGVTMTPLTQKTAEELKLSVKDGVYIYEVSAGSAAEKAGLKKGDVLTAIDGAKVNTPATVQEKITAYRPGDKANLTVIRDGKTISLKATFQSSETENGAVNDAGEIAFYGATLRACPKAKLDKFGLKSGVEIVSAGKGKIRNAGASDGFVIEYVNDKPVKSPQDVIDIAKKSSRSIFVEGVTASGRPGYFGFGKDE